MFTFSRFLISIIISSCAARIYQSSEVGENATVAYQMEVNSGQSQCGPLIATGTVTVINTVLVFNPGMNSPVKVFFLFNGIFLLGNTSFSDALDMFILVRNASRCVQYGGWNYEEGGCELGGQWPASWDSSEASTYTATADLSVYQLSGSTWDICVGNGYVDAREGYSPSYEGSLDFTSSLITTGFPPSMIPSSAPSSTPSLSAQPTHKPIHSPSALPTTSFAPSPSPSNTPSALPTISFMPTLNPFQVVSDCNETVDMTFSTQLAGTERSCSEFPASGTLDMVNMSLQFSGSTSDEYASDLLLIIANTSLTGGIQIGGFNSYVSGLQYVGQWPQSWVSSNNGLYTASVNVTAFNIAGEGFYTICLANGYAGADAVSYVGRVQLVQLDYRCDVQPTTEMPSLSPTSATPTSQPSVPPTISPTTIPTQTPTVATAELSANSTLTSTASIAFDAHLNGDQYLCVDVYATGAIVNVSLVTYFSSSNANGFASDLLVSIVAPVSGQCLVVGGRVTSLVCPSPVEEFSWSSALDSPQAGDYADEVAVQSSGLLGDGMWQVDTKCGEGQGAMGSRCSRPLMCTYNDVDICVCVVDVHYEWLFRREHGHSVLLR